MYKPIIATLLLTLSCTNYAACNSAITRIAPDSRYELLNSNTEVKDKQTGLIWQRCSLGQAWSGSSCTGNAATYNWANALQTAKNMGGGWRVPNIKELDSLIELACYNPSINDTYFPNTITTDDDGGVYWSSTPYEACNCASSIRFYDGYDSRDPKGNNIHLRLVRSSQ